MSQQKVTCPYSSLKQKEKKSHYQQITYVEGFFFLVFKNLLGLKIYLFMYMCENVHEYLCATCMTNAWKGQMILAHLELKFKGAVSCYVGAGN